MTTKDLEKEVSQKTNELEELHLKFGKACQKQVAQDKKTKEVKTTYDLSKQTLKILSFVTICMSLTTILSFSIPFFALALTLNFAEVFTIIKFVKYSKCFKQEKENSEKLKLLADEYYLDFKNAEKTLNDLIQKLDKHKQADNFAFDCTKNNSYDVDSNDLETNTKI